MTQYTVKYDLTEKEEEALRELQPCYQQYIAKDGSSPFEKYTMADVFQSLMYIGSRHTIVAPLAGAWIEISLISTSTSSVGRSPRGSVD